MEREEHREQLSLADELLPPPFLPEGGHRRGDDDPERLRPGGPRPAADGAARREHAAAQGGLAGPVREDDEGVAQEGPDLARAQLLERAGRPAQRRPQRRRDLERPPAPVRHGRQAMQGGEADAPEGLSSGKLEAPAQGARLGGPEQRGLDDALDRAHQLGDAVRLVGDGDRARRRASEVHVDSQRLERLGKGLLLLGLPAQQVKEAVDQLLRQLSEGRQLEDRVVVEVVSHEEAELAGQDLLQAAGDEVEPVHARDGPERERLLHVELCPLHARVPDRHHRERLVRGRPGQLPVRLAEVPDFPEQVDPRATGLGLAEHGLGHKDDRVDPAHVDLLRGSRAGVVAHLAVVVDRADPRPLPHSEAPDGHPEAELRRQVGGGEGASEPAGSDFLGGRLEHRLVELGVARGLGRGEHQPLGRRGRPPEVLDGGARRSFKGRKDAGLGDLANEGEAGAEALDHEVRGREANCLQEAA